jgi:hypothetical protein
LLPNFFFVFHNFLTTVFVAIFCVRASFKPGCKDKRFSFSLPNFFSVLSSLFSTVFSAYFIPPGVNFLCKELRVSMLFCKAGRKDNQLSSSTKYFSKLFLSFC